MERLTLTKEQREVEGVSYAKYVKPEILQEWDKKLAAYEDLGSIERIEQFISDVDTIRECGLSSKEIVELSQAKKQGRLVMLPCNGTVFIHSSGHAQEMEIVHYSGNNTGVYAMRCECKEQYEDCDAICNNGHEKACAYQFRIAEIGKTIFLTREAAEAALTKTP